MFSILAVLWWVSGYLNAERLLSSKRFDEALSQCEENFIRTAFICVGGIIDMLAIGLLADVLGVS